MTLGAHSDLCVARATDRAHGGAIMFTDAVRASAITIQEAVRHAIETLQKHNWVPDSIDQLIMHQTSETTLDGAVAEINRVAGRKVCHRGNTAVQSRRARQHGDEHPHARTRTRRSARAASSPSRRSCSQSVDRDRPWGLPCIALIARPTACWANFAGVRRVVQLPSGRANARPRRESGSPPWAQRQSGERRASRATLYPSPLLRARLASSKPRLTALQLASCSTRVSTATTSRASPHSRPSPRANWASTTGALRRLDKKRSPSTSPTARLAR